MAGGKLHARVAGSMFYGVELVVLTQRLGYGHALLAGLKMVTTPYVLVVQVPLPCATAPLMATIGAF